MRSARIKGTSAQTAMFVMADSLGSWRPSCPRHADELWRHVPGNRSVRAYREFPQTRWSAS
jgi:hypothetical protein